MIHVLDKLRVCITVAGSNQSLPLAGGGGEERGVRISLMIHVLDKLMVFVLQLLVPISRYL